MRTGRPFPSSFYTSPTMNRKDSVFGHHEVEALVTPCVHFFLSSYGMWGVETLLLQRGIEPSRFGR